MNEDKKASNVEQKPDATKPVEVEEIYNAAKPITI